MGYNRRGQRDGTGSYKDSYRRRIKKKSIGRRRENGERCPKK